MADHEIYPNPPVALALLEAKHPPTLPLSTDQLAIVKQALSKVVPIQRAEEAVELNMQTGDRKASRFDRFISRDLHTSVSFKPDAVVLESTLYRGWNWFLDLIGTALEARLDAGVVDGVERLGLRYVNEIRVPDKNPQWRDWVRESLVGPVPSDSGLDLILRDRQGVSVLTTPQENETIILRYTSGEGQAVVSAPNLTRPDEPSGPFFLIDIDSVWVPPREGVPEFDPEAIRASCTRLHMAASSLFEFCTTEKLRKEVLRHDH